MSSATSFDQQEETTINYDEEKKRQEYAERMRQANALERKEVSNVGEFKVRSSEEVQKLREQTVQDQQRINNALNQFINMQKTKPVVVQPPVQHTTQNFFTQDQFQQFSNRLKNQPVVRIPEAPKASSLGNTNPFAQFSAQQLGSILVNANNNNKLREDRELQEFNDLQARRTQNQQQKQQQKQQPTNLPNQNQNRSQLEKTSTLVQQNQNLVNTLKQHQQYFQNNTKGSSASLNRYNAINAEIAANLIKQLQNPDSTYSNRITSNLDSLQDLVSKIQVLEQSRERNAERQQNQRNLISTVEQKLAQANLELEQAKGQTASIPGSVSAIEQRITELRNNLLTHTRVLDTLISSGKRMTADIEVNVNRQQIHGALAHAMAVDQSLDLSQRYQHLAEVEKRSAVERLTKERTSKENILKGLSGNAATSARQELASIETNIRILRDSPSSLFQSEATVAFMSSTIERLILDSQETNERARVAFVEAANLQTQQASQLTSDVLEKSALVIQLRQQMATLQAQSASAQNVSSTGAASAAQELLTSNKKVIDLQSKISTLEAEKQTLQQEKTSAVSETQTLRTQINQNNTFINQLKAGIMQLSSLNDPTTLAAQQEELGNSLDVDTNPDEVRNLGKTLKTNSALFKQNYDAAVNTAKQTLQTQLTQAQNDSNTYKKELEDLKAQPATQTTQTTDTTKDNEITNLKKQLADAIQNQILNETTWDQIKGSLDSAKLNAIITRLGGVVEQSQINTLKQEIDDLKKNQVADQTVQVDTLNKTIATLTTERDDAVKAKTDAVKQWTDAFAAIGVNSVDPAIIAQQLKNATAQIGSVAQALNQVFNLNDNDVKSKTTAELVAALQVAKTIISTDAAIALKNELKNANGKLEAKETELSEKVAELKSANATIATLRETIAAQTSDQSTVAALKTAKETAELQVQTIEKAIETALGQGANSGNFVQKIKELTTTKDGLQTQVNEVISFVSKALNADKSNNASDAINSLFVDMVNTTRDLQSQVDTLEDSLRETQNDLEKAEKEKTAQAKVLAEKEKEIEAEKEQTKKMKEVIEKFGTAPALKDGHLINFKESDLVKDAAIKNLENLADTFASFKLLNKNGSRWETNEQELKSLKNNQKALLTYAKTYAATWLNHFSFEDNTPYLLTGFDWTTGNMNDDIKNVYKNRLEYARSVFLQNTIKRFLKNPQDEISRFSTFLNSDRDGKQNYAQLMTYFQSKDKENINLSGNATKTPGLDGREAFMSQIKIQATAYLDNKNGKSHDSVTGVELLKLYFNNDEILKDLLK